MSWYMLKPKLFWGLEVQLFKPKHFFRKKLFLLISSLSMSKQPDNPWGAWLFKLFVILRQAMMGVSIFNSWGPRVGDLDSGGDSKRYWTHFHAQWWQMGGRVFIRNHDCWAMIGWNHVRIHHPTLLLLMRLATCLSNENQKQNCQHIQQRVPFIYLDGDLHRLHISSFHWSKIFAVVR